MTHTLERGGILPPKKRVGAKRLEKINEDPLTPELRKIVDEAERDGVDLTQLRKLHRTGAVRKSWHGTWGG